MKKFYDSFWAIRCVWLRYFDVFRKGLFYGMVTTFIEPMLLLVAFGFGLGSMVGEMEIHGIRLTYRQFVFAGILGQTIMFQCFFEAAYGSFIRMYYQKIFQAISITPITLSEVLWGELLWDSSRGMFSASVVLLIGCLTGDFSKTGALLALPFCFMSAFLFSALGLWVAGISKTIEQISYPQYLFVFPMFMFCGIFYPLENLPVLVQKIVWLLPLTAFVSIGRHFILDFPYESTSLPVLIFWLILLTWQSRKAMSNRLIK